MNKLLESKRPKSDDPDFLEKTEQEIEVDCAVGWRKITYDRQQVKIADVKNAKCSDRPESIPRFVSVRQRAPPSGCGESSRRVPFVIGIGCRAWDAGGACILIYAI
ncbi:hypothetical protein J2785_003136 [Burkholderia ambifaria]|nr:hypothetical protein [Burkholderia ambifaria]MDR6499980.1 hypothetical protein [Burkholderia ambifaria]